MAQTPMIEANTSIVRAVVVICSMALASSAIAVKQVPLMIASVRLRLSFFCL